MLPGRRQVIIWTNVGLLSIGTLRTNFSEKLSEIYAFSFKKMHFKMSSAKWRQLCFGLNVLTVLKCQKAIYQKTFERHSIVRIFRLYLDLRLFITHIHVRKNWWNSMNWWSGHMAVQQTVDLPVIWDAMELMWPHFNGMNSKNSIS